jgi:adenylyltransferase/sulfurtransferase
MQAEIPTITVHQLKQMIDQGASDYVLVDVRNPEEYTIARIPGSTLIPHTRD